ncbi:MAG TPA: aldose 1-epimerase [Gemmata sp.]|nr:aldose 1-epimerase [Gemmata sp.]
MAFEVRVSHVDVGGKAGDVYELIDTRGTVRAEVWPQWGFNCLRWQIRQADARWADILFASGDWETNPVPTRSGHPILFPFPGRLRDAKFTFEGNVYQLPFNDSTKQHAIHGFTPRNPWRVIDWNGDEDFAFVTGQFNLKKDLPDALSYWPADFNLNVTYRLFRDRLRVDATVENLGPGPLPFGLGYHPYFRLPGVHDPDIGGHVLQANVDQVWETEMNLPTGWRKDVPGEIDFRYPTPLGSTELDYVFTDVRSKSTSLGELVEIAKLSHPEAMGQVRFLADAAFRELVLFTPPHRQAIAIEPYTCSADAANLANRGIDSGWKVIPRGTEWEAAVEYRWEPAEL